MSFVHTLLADLATREGPVLTAPTAWRPVASTGPEPMSDADGLGTAEGTLRRATSIAEAFADVIDGMSP